MIGLKKALPFGIYKGGFFIKMWICNFFEWFGLNSNKMYKNHLKRVICHDD